MPLLRQSSVCFEMYLWFSEMLLRRKEITLRDEMLYWCKNFVVFIRCNKFYKARAEVTGLPQMMTAGSKQGAGGRNRHRDRRPESGKGGPSNLEIICLIGEQNTYLIFILSHT